MRIRIVTPPHFIALKLEAFGDRGGGDYTRSLDMEDIIQVIDGWPELVQEVRDAEPELRAYISERFRALLATEAFREAVPSHLLPDRASQARESLVISRMQQIADFAPPRRGCRPTSAHISP